MLGARWERKRRQKYRQQQQCRNHQSLTWRPARAERETAFALALPESLPALPPACRGKNTHTLSTERKHKPEKHKMEAPRPPSNCEVRAADRLCSNNKCPPFAAEPSARERGRETGRSIFALRGGHRRRPASIFDSRGARAMRTQAANAAEATCAAAQISLFAPIRRNYHFCSIDFSAAC